MRAALSLHRAAETGSRTSARMTRESPTKHRHTVIRRRMHENPGNGPEYPAGGHRACRVHGERGRRSRPGRRDHDQRREAGRRDQESREGRPDDRRRLTRIPISRSSGTRSRSIESTRAVPGGDIRRQASIGLVEAGPGAEDGRAGRRHAREAAGYVGRAAVRADILGAVRRGPGLRLQHDAHQLGEAALARDEPVLP